VQVDESAFIFLGSSGAGKSTICRLLSPFATPLADDRAFLIPQEKREWAVADATGYPRRCRLREEEAAALIGVPLKGIFRLYQAHEPRLEKTGALITCHNLAKAFFEFYWHRDLSADVKKPVFSILADISRLVPGYDLHFDLSSQTVELMQEIAVQSLSASTL
jgi:hypothetical protein